MDTSKFALIGVVILALAVAPGLVFLFNKVFGSRLPNRIEERNRIMGFVIGLVLAIEFSILYLAGPLRTFDSFDLDLKFRTRQSLTDSGIKSFDVPTSEDIIFVDIDDLTLDWEETFPDDPRYYVPIIKRLGKEQLGAEAVVFTFEYSRDYGRRVVPDSADGFRIDLQTMADTLGDRATMVDNLDNITQPPGLAGPDQAPIIAEKLDQLLTPEDQRSRLKLPALDTVTKNFQWILKFLDEADLNDLAPNREKALRDASAEAGNVFIINSSKEYLPTPYVAGDMKSGPVRDIFIEIIRRPTSNRPEQEKQGMIYDAYQNLNADGLEFLLKKDKNELPADVRKEILRDLTEKKSALDELHKQAGAYMFDLPDRVRDRYVRKRFIEPVHSAVGEALAGMGIGSAEFTAKDGTLRSVAPAVVYDNKLYPHIDLLLAMEYFNVKKENVEFYPRRVVLKNAKHPRTGKTRDIVIPLTAEGAMIINWAGVWADTTTFEHRNLKNLWTKVRQIQLYEAWEKFTADTQGMSDEQIAQYKLDLSLEQQDDLDMAELLNQSEALIDKKQADEYRKSMGSLQGKILLVGRTAVGTAEINPIPLEPRYHFVGLHANAVNTIISGLFIHNINPGLAVVLFLVLGMSLGFVGGLVHTKSSFLTAGINFVIMIVFAVVLFSVTISAFGLYNFAIPFLLPLALIVLTFLAVFLYRFVTEEREKNKMKGMFSTYVNKEVVDSLIDDPAKLRLGGEWVECTVFFSDVAGFTSISESLTPEELVVLLNEYLTAMTDIVFHYGGTLDKYIGDAIVAIYGAPIFFEDHAKNACLATIDMQRKLAEMRVMWKEQGRHELTARCGVNTGRMIAGNMGSKNIFNYTVVGDHCELGEHLESGGKEYGTIMTISERTRELSGGAILTRQLDVIKYKGIPEPIGLYEILAKTEEGIPENIQKGVALHEEALHLFLERKWDESIAKYNEVYQFIPDDKPTKMAIGRVEKAKADPPGPEFDKLLDHYLKTRA
jgi:class 3 adenylate cyclase